jgi:hypothetical protein
MELWHPCQHPLPVRDIVKLRETFGTIVVNLLDGTLVSKDRKVLRPDHQTPSHLSELATMTPFVRAIMAAILAFATPNRQAQMACCTDVIDFVKSGGIAGALACRNRGISREKGDVALCHATHDPA